MKTTDLTDQRRTSHDLVEQAISAMKANGSPSQIAAVSVCDEVLATLSKMEANLVNDVQAGLIEISEQIAAEQTMPDTPERIVLELIAESTKGLTQAISDAFKQHRSVVRFQRDRFVLGKINGKQMSAAAKEA